jgi:hypothetical protein
LDQPLIVVLVVLASNSWRVVWRVWVALVRVVGILPTSLGAPVLVPAVDIPMQWKRPVDSGLSGDLVSLKVKVNNMLVTGWPYMLATVCRQYRTKRANSALVLSTGSWCNKALQHALQQPSTRQQRPFAHCKAGFTSHCLTKLSHRKLAQSSRPRQQCNIP